jgi:type III restriction enzyme
MSLEQTLRAVAGRLSLREPQAESLRRLAAALESVPALRDHQARDAADLTAMVEALKGQFPTLTDFERDFPSLCFALATGVGKTRLMGAFISYLNAAYGYKHFFVLAPNLTIYDKLIRDFTPGTPKYVFKGIAEFAAAAPEVITGETYEQRGDLVSQAIDAPVQINIFNISKINTEVRGGKAPRIKRLSEYLGQSYFDYLASLPDLVLLMDESHRYRASAGVRSLNELKPLLAMELTATPFTESSKGPVPFKNVVMDYPLAQAIEDGFVKEPAVVTQQNFDPSAHSAEQLERIKLMDGVRVHEETKVHLLTYAQQKGASGEVKPVKPFMLVIARDTTHAAALSQLLTTELFDGRYAGKVIQVDSGTTSGAEGDEIVQRLLAVESYDEPTEIVIHVNMLKEGWDVTNLYTIVPLRAANARTLIEQSIGRGLRLPYGRKTGVEVVDRLNIIAHDKFQEVVDEAGRGDSPIRLKQLKLAPPVDGGPVLRSVAVTPTLHGVLGIAPPTVQPSSTAYPAVAAPTVLFTGGQVQIAAIAMDVINDMSRLTTSSTAPTRSDGPPVTAPTASSLATAEVQAELVRRVQARMTPAQGELLPAAGPSVEEIVRQTAALVAQHTIDIPRILIKPKGPVSSGYRSFALDVSRMNFQPQDQQLMGRGLQSGKELLYGQSSFVTERRPEDYIVRELIGFDDIAYDQHGELLYALAGQAVAHFRGYLKTDEELHNVLANHGKAIAENIHAQMAQHYFEDSGESEVVVSQGFTALKPSAITAEGDVLPLHQAPQDKNRIAALVYGGFTKCAYTYQKFQSDPERVLAVILERDALKWLRPVAGQFNIYYRRGADQPEYIPDFAAAAADMNLLIETKKATDMQSDEVQTKARAAAVWCANASAYATANGSKPWRYLLIPHDVVQVNATLGALATTYWFRDTSPPPR